MQYQIRPALPQDVPTIVALIKALASYERLADQAVGTVEQLHDHLFGDRLYVEALVAEVTVPTSANSSTVDSPSNPQVVGFALFFPNYSTFLTQPGLYLEDLFVLPDYRGQGIGKALLVSLAGIALARGYGRMEWSVLDWNAPAIGFYERMGATVLPDWRICRVTRDALVTMQQLVSEP